MDVVEAETIARGWLRVPRGAGVGATADAGGQVAEFLDVDVDKLAVRRRARIG